MIAKKKDKRYTLKRIERMLFFLWIRLRGRYQLLLLAPKEPLRGTLVCSVPKGFLLDNSIYAVVGVQVKNISGI